MSIPLGHGRVPLTALHESAVNPRTISVAKLEQLKHTLRGAPDLLDARPIICTPDGEILAGNMRFRALLAIVLEDPPESLFVHMLQDEGVRVWCVQANDAQRREIMLLDNQSFGRWDDEKLAEIVKAHAAADADLAMLGFGDAELASIARVAVGAHDRRVAPDQGPPAAEPARPRPGDTVVFGTHRLTVGPGGDDLLDALIATYTGHAGTAPEILAGP